MQDNALLGENPNATVSAQTDMSFDLPDNFEQEYQKRQTLKAPAKDYDITGGDFVKSVGVGALGMVSGLGELSEQLTGYGEGLRDVAQSGSDYLVDSMTDDGKAALSAELFTEKDGKLGVGQGAGDIDVWAMKFAQGIGSLAGGMIPGGAAGSVTRMVASSMLKRGASKLVAEQVASRTASILGETAATGTFIAGSHGSAMQDGRQQVLDMDAGWLADNSEHFQNSLSRIVNDPNNQGMSSTEMVNLAKEETANFVSKTIMGDPATIAASIAGAYGDKLLFGAVAGKASKGILKGAGKGALTEASTEALENVGQTYGTNVAMNEVAGTNRDPWEGAAKNALEGAAIGALTGSVPGAVGGMRGKSDNVTEEPENNDTQESEEPEVEPVQGHVDPIPEQPIKTQVEALTETPLPAQQAEQPQDDYQPFSSAKPAALVTDLNKAIEELKTQDRSDERARQARQDLARYADTLTNPDNLQPDVLEAVRQNAKQIVDNYWGVAPETEPEQSQKQEPLNVDSNNSQQDDPEQQVQKQQLSDAISRGELGFADEEAQRNARFAEGLQKAMEISPAAVLQVAQGRREGRFSQERAIHALQMVINSVSSQDTNTQPVTDPDSERELELRTAANRERVHRGDYESQPETERVKNGFKWQQNQEHTSAFYRDAGKERSVNEPFASGIENQHAPAGTVLIEDEDTKRASEGRLTRSQIDDLKSHAANRQQERTNHPIKTGMTKRLRRKIQRSKGFDTETVLDEFRNSEKRLQAYQNEARIQAEREAKNPENIQRRKSAQALFEEKISSPEAKQFAESLITDSIKRVDETLNKSAGTVLEMDGQQISLPKVKGQMANSIRNLANKFIGKTAALDENLRAKRAVSEESKSEEPSQIREPEQKIEDFGEKIGDARKDVWADYAAVLSHMENTGDVPLSKSFPEPDYKKLVDNGLSKDTAALIAVLRNSLPTKPRVAHRLGVWVNHTNGVKEFVAGLLDGSKRIEDLSQKYVAYRESSQDILRTLPSLAKADLSVLKEASNYRITSGSYSMFGGKRYSPSKTFYHISYKGKEQTSTASENLNDVQQTLDNLIADLNQNGVKEKQSNIGVYQDRHTKQVFLGWKGSKGVLRIQNFDTSKIARDYLNIHRDKVEDRLAKLKRIPNLRRESNSVRVGPSRYNGNVTPDLFAKEFGFRGVEFGNWVEQGKRQRDLNDAYDGLMDLAEILGIPPKAISLNGELGLAFGARGKGGKDPASAHYEPGKVVINLTKKAGAGSLAHEWFHALDHYFGRSGGPSDSFISESPYIKRTGQREQVQNAFKELSKVLVNSDLESRSRELDKTKSKQYYSEVVELGARSFESYIIDQLYKQDMSNDYLANITSEEGWNALNELEDSIHPYPYPTVSDKEIIFPAFENLFTVLETKPTDKGIALFSRESVTHDKPSTGMTLKGAKLAADQWLRDYKGGAGVKVTVVKTQAEAEGIMGMQFDGSVVHALYRDSTGEVVVVADNIANPKELRKKLRHEILVHHGLKAVVGDSEYQNILTRIYRGRNSPYLKELWEHIGTHYGQASPIDQVEEVLAYAAESERTRVQQWFDGIVEMIAHALRKVGLMKPSDMTKAELNNIIKTLTDRTKAVEHWLDPAQNPKPNSSTKLSQAKFSKSSRVPDDVKVIKGEPIKGQTIKEKRLYAQQQGFKHAGLYINKDSGFEITVGRKGVKHTTARKAFDDLLSSMKFLDKIIEDSSYLGTESDNKGNANVKAHHYFGIKYEVNGNTHDVVVDVREMPDGKFYYDHSFERELSASGDNSSGPLPTSPRTRNNTSRVAEAEGLSDSDDDSSGPRLLTQGPIIPSMGAEPDTSNISSAAKKINNSDGDIKFSKTRKMTLDEALAQDTPHERFTGVLNAISRGMNRLKESKVGGAIRGDIGLGAITLRQLADLAKDKLPQLSQYVDTVHLMLTRRNQLAFDAHDMADGIRKWAAKNRKHADEMFDIAHLATVEGVDPEQPFKSAKETIEKRIQHLELVNQGSHKTNEQMAELKELTNMLKAEPNRKKKHAQLKKRFDKLPEEAKQHYRAMRDKYKERHDLYKRLLEEQISNAAVDGRIKRTRIADMKSQFELQEVMAPYFPLSRFGDYWISVADENGEKRFMMYESEKQQQEAKKKLESQGYDVFSGYKLDKDPRMEGASLGFVVDLMSKVEEAKLNEVKKAELKDAIYQMYLQALPSRSMRKQFMHRQKVKGWSNDALRALAENMVKGSYQLARLEYADELTRLASETAKTAGKSGDNQASRYSNELMKRHEWVMNPKHSSGAQKITSLGFLYMLGFSPAAAAINTTQNFVVALPMIGSKFGFAAASRELGKATMEFIHAKGSIKSKLTNLDELAAFDHWYDSGLLDATNAHDLAGMAEGQNWKYNPAYEKFSGWMSALFHKAEVFNRETTALAGYRLARKNGTPHNEAVQYAEKMTWDAHFDYTNVNRARYMQSPTMKVATQFKQYSQNMTYYLMRNAYLSMKGMDEKERSGARKQLIGTLGVTALLAGISALPLSLIYGVANGLNAVFGDDDEPYDAETEFKTYLADVFGSDMADKIIYGAGGAGLSPRISLDGMWLRDANRDMEGEDTWSFYAKQAAGPVLGGILVQAMIAKDKMADGDYYRAIEGMVPKVFKDGMKAYRYAEEGALNSRGDAYREAEDFSTLDLGLQAMGMTPDELSKQYQLNNARKQYEQHVLDRRSNLMKAYYLAWKQRDTGLMLETQKAIGKFNRKYPKLALTSQKIKQSIKTRQRYSQRSSSGVNLNKNLRNFESEVVW
ncbi:PLxRFG domain-containing protein [Vibrio sp. HA2012]|uniref:PLxRFG domain-containing protein n=1 Tax=Vibrio sp. HA2012 TaxID=1971595 RepID=UPI000C2C5C04|nr:PLxRFG domain-containing protein [Vibrio sp. HA2012]PJC87854.1 PLxRFG domain-containing protein [Vibrio sp. HA2012]